VSHQAVEQAWSRLFPGNPVPTVLETGWKRLQAVSLAFDGKTVAEIADATGFSTHSVYYHLRQLGVAFEPGASTATDQASIDAAIADVEAGASMVDAAIDNGVGREPLRKAMRERGVESSVRGGARHGGLARALTLIEQGASAPEAARAARVATSSIYAKRAKLIRQRAEARP
jgi:DNA-binding phage protein